MGICHAYAPDGRCISLLKILLTNFCVYDCAYCINRVSSNTPRARFSPEEVVDLTLGFYKRNYIEGLFLSSGIIRDEDYTMAAMNQVARTLREVHDFRGYIHLKVIPDASPELIEEAGRWADRLSINIELPKDESIADFAPEKNPVVIKRAMGAVRSRIDEQKEARTVHKEKGRAKPPRTAPAGQSTQMIIGADDASDADILTRSSTLYGSYDLRRVYYSAFSPIPDSTSKLPLAAPPLVREHRLYQADWLMRFYGFSKDEIVSGGEGGMLDAAVDPKLAWALKHREDFPMDVNRATREQLLRVPGLGVKSVDKIISVRRYKTLRLEDVGRLTRGLERVRPFLVAADWTPGALLDRGDLRGRLTPAPQQLSLF
jgi:putative DNA modification/repair radical SAM protein